MHVNLIGINYRTAPIGIREKAAVRAGKLAESLTSLRSCMPQGIILSTCNRTEVYTIDPGRQAEEASSRFMQGHLDITEADLSRYAYGHRGIAAAEHLFRLACGLDSMIVGEYEVLGQVGQALEAAEKAGMVSLPLRHLLQSAIRTGRRVRTETEISKNALSVSSVAVDMAAKVTGDLAKSRMLVIGAGEAGRLVAKAAKERGVSRILVASRTKERASTLAALLGVTPVSLDDLSEELANCDIVVSCADAPHRVLNLRQLATAMQKRPERPMVLIDIAIPRNIDPAAAKVSNVYLYNIDDLTYMAKTNRHQREGEIEKAEAIITAEIAKFATWWQMLEVRPVVGALMSKAEAIRSTQLNRTLKKLRPLSDEEQGNLEAMTRSIVTKILQEPINYLKGKTEDNGDYARMVSQLFHLEIER